MQSLAANEKGLWGMKVFKDSIGREWSIVVNVGTAKAVKDLTTINLFDVYNKEECMRLFSDPVLLVNVLYVLCKKQCEERKLTDEQFGEGLVGDAIEEAATVLLEEVANFFPSRRRKILETLLTKSKEATAAVEKELMQKVEAITIDGLQSSMKSPG